MDKPIRVMWLLNHGAARKFDLLMLKQLGITEVFTPKKFPSEIGFRSASVDFSMDTALTIPAADLAFLNDADWYDEPGEQAWEIANKHFDVAFFISHRTNMIRSIARHFKGALLWRAFGHDKTMSYTQIIEFEPLERTEALLKACGERFWMANSYPHLPEVEKPFLAERHLFLPLGLADCKINDVWTGEKKSIFFVCPDIGFNSYYQKIHRDFVHDFGDFDYVIAGSQPIKPPHPHVLGFVSAEEHQRNMREFAVMFYHSQEPNHIHYHPFEAIRGGMPLVFMAEGMLDRMGGMDQPGRCTTVDEARRKIRRIMEGDKKFIASIRENQTRMLESMHPEECLPDWQTGFSRIFATLDKARPRRPAVVTKTKKRIAVIVPIGYRGGSLRGAKLLAEAIWEGARQSGEEAEVVLAHLDDEITYPDSEFADLHPAVTRRGYYWRALDRTTARRAMTFAGCDWEPDASHYLVPDDSMNQFLDCDAWVIVSDRIATPLLPIRPYLCMVYDYLQRYENILPPGGDEAFLATAAHAQAVMVTTQFTEQDALDYAGLPPRKVKRVPMLAPRFAAPASPPASRETGTYFIWTTNAAAHKNHENAILAIKEYYEALGGTLACRVTGVATDTLLTHEGEHLKSLQRLVGSSALLQNNIQWLGDLPDASYRNQLAGAAFLLHAGRIDNGTFSVVEAAHFGVPALSSDYPAMREMDAQFQLNLQWMDAATPTDMARQLKFMEENARLLRGSLPGKAVLASQNPDQLAGEYWKVVRACL